LGLTPATPNNTDELLPHPQLPMLLRCYGSGLPLYGTKQKRAGVLLQRIDVFSVTNSVRM